MALDYRSVLDIYDASREGGLTDKSLPDWSQEMNTKTGTELYSAGLHDNFIKRGSAGLDKLIEATGIPAYGASVGGDIGEAVGDRAAGEKVGGGLGRMAVNFAPLLIPGVGWGATAARLGGTALLSGAETYTSTDSPAAGLLSAGTAAALPKVADVAEQFALGKLGARLATKEVTGQADRYIGETLGQKVGSAAAGQVAAAGLFGASGAAQEVAAGEPVSSPLTTENLLSLTLGQLPFAAAHLGGRAIHEQFGGKTAAMRADEIKNVLDLSEATLKLREVKKEMDDKPPVKDMPDVAKPEAEAFTPEQYELARKNRLIISQIRGDMIKVKDDPTLTDEQKVEQTNDLMNQDYAALKESEAALVDKNTIFGNRIQADEPRTSLYGKQLAINKTGSWRAIHVADDPINPEELRGKVVSYSTYGEEPVRWGFQSQETGNAMYSMPDPQWWTQKTKEEWDAGGRKGKKDIVDPNLAPELPTLEQPMSDEEVSAHLSELANVSSAIDAAATTGDLQKAVTDLNDVRAQNNMSPVSDDTLKFFIERLTTPNTTPDKVVKKAATAVTTKTKRTITVKQQADLINAGYDQATIDALTPEQKKDALEAARTVLRQRKKAEIKPEFEATEDAVAEEEARVTREEQRAAALPTKEEAAAVAAKFGEDNDTMRGMSIVTADKVSQGKTDDVATQSVAEVVNDAAVAAINDPKVMEVFDMLPDKGERSIHKDAADFVDLVEEFGSLKDLDPKEASDYLNSKLEVTSVEPGDVADFLSQPHVKVMSDALDRNLTDARRTNEAPVPIAPERISAGDQFHFALPTNEEFQRRLKGSVPKSGLVPIDLFQKKGGLSKDQPLAKGEIDLYKLLVPEAFKGNAVHVETLAKGLQERGPTIEVVTHREGEPASSGLDEDTTRAAAGQLQHLLEARGYHPDIHFDEARVEDANNKEVVGDWVSDADFDGVYQTRLSSLPEADQQLITQWFGHAQAILGDEYNQRQPGLHYPGVATPKNLTQMPGSVELLVKLSLTKARMHDTTYEEFMRSTGRADEPLTRELFDKTKEKEAQAKEPPSYRAPHFDEAGNNLVVHVRGYIETLPDGTKAFHVFELQSDWAQQQRDRVNELKTGEVKLLAHNMFRVGTVTLPEEGLKRFGWKDTGLVGQDLLDDVRKFVTANLSEIASNPSKLGKEFEGFSPGHPLLEATNTLGLKAAIQHAKSVGVDKVILSDAETAMMTEGHDRASMFLKDMGTPEAARTEADRLNAKYGTTTPDARGMTTDRDIFDTDGSQVYANTVLGRAELNDATLKSEGFGATPKQEKGMRLNYDQVLPSAMEKLTGDRGQEVDLGQHKMSDATQRAPGTPDGSPVFKDAAGNPKTNITGRAYDISKAGPDFSLFGAREAPTEGTTPQTTAPRHDAPPWVPEAPRDVEAIANMGLNGNGKDMLRFITNSGHELLSSLGVDLAKFGPSLERIFGGVYDIGTGAFVTSAPGGRYEIRMSPGLLRADPVEAAYTLAHELVHGLTLAELHNPTKAGYVEAFNSMRGRLIGALPEPMKRAINDAISSDWYSKWGRREVTLESLYPQGTVGERAILYSLLNNDELVTGGLTAPAMQRFMRSVKSEGKPWYSKFAELISTVLELGNQVKGTLWEEFLHHTSGLMDRGSHVADFKNYANRYFENLGMQDNFVRTNTQRAMGLILSNLNASHDVADVLQRVRLGSGNVRSPEWMQAVGDTNKMFAEKGDDAEVTKMTLTEAGHMPDQMGLMDFADSVMSGKIDPEFIDMLPEAAARLVFETAKDTANIVGVVRGATLDQNRGVLNVANPELLHNLSKETLKSVDKVLAQNTFHDMAVKDIQGLFAMPPDGFQDKMVNAPDETPPEFWGESKRSMFDHIENFISPATQIARSIPEAAEAFSRGRQLHANQRKMATEAQKPFGMDLETMDLSSDSVKNTAKTFEQPRLTNAVNKWIHQNQVVGDRTGEVRVLDVDDPRLQDALKGLSAKDRDIVEDMVNKQSYSTQFVQGEILEKRLQIGTTDGAVIAQKAEGGKLRDAVAKSEQLIRAFVADRTDPVAARTADAQIAEVQQKMSLEGFNKLATFAQIVAEGYKTQEEIFKKNPAWASGQRHGKFLMEFTKNGKAQLQGVESRKEAEVIAGGKPFKLTPNRQEDADRPPFMGFGSSDTIAKLRDLDQAYIDHMQSSGAFTPDQIELMKRYSPVEQFTTEQVYRGGVRGVTPQPRRLTKGAEELPWLENHFTFINKTANYWSRQLFRSQARAHLLDPEISSNPDLHNKLESYYENLLTPDTPLGHFLQRSATSWFMGYNPASALVNATQPFMTHIAEFTRMTGKPFNSYKRVLGGLGEVIAHAKTKKWANEDHTWLIHKATQDGFVDNTMFDDNAAAQETVATRFKQILSRQRPQTTGQRLGTLAGSFSSVGMWMFRTVERMNNMSALLSSYDLYKELQPNLSRDQLYEKAVSFNEAVNYGGGPAARPIGLYKAAPRTVAMLATSMQSYNLGSMFQLARYLKDGFFRPEGLTPHEVYSARIAGVQMLATQLGAAGVLGLPLVSGMLAVLNQMFPGLELNRHFREGMAKVMGGDEKNGNVLGDIAMTGVPSMMGWDLQSRLSMGNTIPGVSEVNGFQPEQLAGAPVSLITNFVKGGIKLASGDPHGAEAFVPNALKKFEQLLRSGGQVLDYRDRPVFTPTLGEKVGIALGFNPKRLSDFNAASRMARQTDDNIKRREGEFHQSMAEEVLKGNFGTVQQQLRQRIKQDKTYDPVNAARSIAGSAEELTFPRDLRREGPASAADPRAKLLATFNLPSNQPSETGRLLFRQQVERRLGIPATSSTDLQTATVMDRLRQQQPLAPRAELRRQATLLLRGSRPQTLLTPTE